MQKRNRSIGDKMFQDDEIKKIRKQREKWEQLFASSTKNHLERKEKFTTLSNIEVKSIYTPEDIKTMDYDRHLGFPSMDPFTRGVHTTMYRGKIWTMRQFAGFGTAEESNRRYLYLLEHGETGLSVAFDYPTLYGYDTDHPLARGEFGKCGVAVSSLKDMEILFQGIPLDKITTSMTINGPAAILWAMYIATA